MNNMDNEERRLTKFLQNEARLTYPDFDAMWNRIHRNLPDPAEQLLPVDLDSSARKRLFRPAFIFAMAILVVATPVFAAISFNWDDFLHPQSGIRSALHQGLGQMIEQTDTINGVQLTVHTAVVDDNRTVLLFSMRVPEISPNEIPRFTEMFLTDTDGRLVDGRQRMIWDEGNNIWRGYFEAEWTPNSTQAEVHFSMQHLQLFAATEREIPVDRNSTFPQTFLIGQDGINRLVIQTFDQGDRVMIATSTFFDQPEAKEWAYPRIGVFNGTSQITEASSGAFGKPGEQGEYSGQQYYQSRDLQTDNLAYKLMYTKLEREVLGEWKFNLHLDKQQMQSGTVKSELNIPIESQAGRMVLQEMVVTPTQIRISARHQKHAKQPYLRHHLEVDGNILRVGSNVYYRDSPEETTYRYELPPEVHVNEHTPIVFVMEYEVVEIEDAVEPIRLEQIGKEKRTITTDVGGYAVHWTYYMQNSDLYVQSESSDPHFGGINQTYMKGARNIPGKPITTNFFGDGNNRAIDKYEDFTGTEAEIYIYFYTVDYPDNGVRIDLTEKERPEPARAE